VYGTRSQASPALIALLLALVIGPAEEIFWRGLMQRKLEGRYGAHAGWILSTMLYAAVHIWALNFMLFMAAVICGIFWGWIYMRYRTLLPGIISHALWDVAIFVLLPVR
jgi:membrane protease YdiL (CAAX protease family)